MPQIKFEQLMESASASVETITPEFLLQFDTWVGSYMIVDHNDQFQQ